MDSVTEQERQHLRTAGFILCQTIILKEGIFALRFISSSTYLFGKESLNTYSRPVLYLAPERYEKENKVQNVCGAHRTCLLHSTGFAPAKAGFGFLLGLVLTGSPRTFNTTGASVQVQRSARLYFLALSSRKQKGKCMCTLLHHL